MYAPLLILLCGSLSVSVNDFPMLLFIFMSISDTIQERRLLQF